MYLSMVTDAYSRRIVGHHIQPACTPTAACRPWSAPCVGPLPLVHHSNRGSWYCSEAYQRALQAARLR
ncbi:MAG: hypothetical protein EOO62_36155 [Hymenobacter sp.]|nr:MAG: hypothetical protein EOO62_36155 [Hymenobacter sp.]